MKTKKTTTPAIGKPRPKKVRYLTCSYKHTAGRGHVPYLRLVGKWLQEAGFEVGTIVSIEERDNSLILTRMPLKWQVERSVTKCVVDDAGNKYSLR